MGAFDTFFADSKEALDSPVPFGGTVIPTSAGFPSLMAWNIKGGLMVLPDVTVLADIPYPLLVLDMEVIVGTYTGHPRAKYVLINLPPENTRVSEIPSYVLTTYWQKQVETADPEPGVNGTNGWTPVIGFEDDGPNRVVAKVLDWTGGTGTKPSAGTPNHYVGPTGFTTKSAATNMKGPAGPTANQRPDYYVSIGSRINNPSTNLSHDTIPGIFLQKLLIENTHSTSRRFYINAEVGFNFIDGSSGRDHGYGAIIVKPGDIVPPAIGDPLPSAGIDDLPKDFGAVMYGNLPGFSNVANKIYLSNVVTIAAGGKATVLLGCSVLGGGPTLRNGGFIEAFGL